MTDLDFDAGFANGQRGADRQLGAVDLKGHRLLDSAVARLDDLVEVRRAHHDDVALAKDLELAPDLVDHTERHCFRVLAVLDQQAGRESAAGELLAVLERVLHGWVPTSPGIRRQPSLSGRYCVIRKHKVICGFNGRAFNPANTLCFTVCQSTLEDETSTKTVVIIAYFTKISNIHKLLRV